MVTEWVDGTPVTSSMALSDRPTVPWRWAYLGPETWEAAFRIEGGGMALINELEHGGGGYENR